MCPPDQTVSERHHRKAETSNGPGVVLCPEVVRHNPSISGLWGEHANGLGGGHRCPAGAV